MVSNVWFHPLPNHDFCWGWPSATSSPKMQLSFGRQWATSNRNRVLLRRPSTTQCRRSTTPTHRKDIPSPHMGLSENDWLVVSAFQPLRKILVSWDDDIRNIWEKKPVPNHQPDEVPSGALKRGRWEIPEQNGGVWRDNHKHKSGMCHCHVWWEGIASNWPFEWGSWYLSIGIRGAPFSTWDAMRCLEWNAGQWDGEATVPDFTSRFKKPPCFRVMRQPNQHLCTTICMCCSKQTCAHTHTHIYIYIYLYDYICI